MRTVTKPPLPLGKAAEAGNVSSKPVVVSAEQVRLEEVHRQAFQAIEQQLSDPADNEVPSVRSHLLDGSMNRTQCSVDLQD
jgi:hypothetical protein